MASTWEGSDGSKRPMKLNGKEIIIEDIGCYDGSIPTTYQKKVTYTFATEEEAMEYYYKKK